MENTDLVWTDSVREKLCIFRCICFTTPLSDAVASSRPTPMFCLNKSTCIHWPSSQTGLDTHWMLPSFSDLVFLSRKKIDLIYQFWTKFRQHLTNDLKRERQREKEWGDREKRMYGWESERQHWRERGLWEKLEPNFLILVIINCYLV